MIVAEQNMGEGFKLGQIRNLGFKKSIGDIIVFFDVDIRLPKKIDFASALLEKKLPIVCWKYITQIEDDINYKKLSKPKEGVGKAGFFALTREQFESVNGYSNLLIGWGKEDNLLEKRFDHEFVRMDEEIYHIKHEQSRELWRVAGSAIKHNLQILRTDSKRDKLNDGFAQTIADEHELDFIGYKHYIFSNVRVVEDFEYKDEFEKLSKYELGV